MLSNLFFPNEYPPLSFFFSVSFGSDTSTDNSFQEVSGISTEMSFEEVEEGGENRFTHRLPKRLKPSNLVLKRGIADSTSPLVIWCKSILEGDLSKKISVKSITIRLLNDQDSPLREWVVENAYPVKWSVDTFNSMKNEVALETIEFSYNTIKRTT